MRKWQHFRIFCATKNEPNPTGVVRPRRGAAPAIPGAGAIFLLHIAAPHEPCWRRSLGRVQSYTPSFAPCKTRDASALFRKNSRLADGVCRPLGRPTGAAFRRATLAGGLRPDRSRSGYGIVDRRLVSPGGIAIARRHARAIASLRASRSECGIDGPPAGAGRRHCCRSPPHAML